MDTSLIETIAYTPTDGVEAPLAWCWFSSPRAIVDTDAAAGPRVLAGAISDGSSATNGDVVLVWRDLASGDGGSVALHENFECDDHNDPAILVRPDGRYLAMYAKHNTDSFLRWRISREPHDPTAWAPERTLDLGAPVTYANVYRINETMYCFSRSINWDPTVSYSTDDGTYWSVAGRMLTFDGPGQRPYPRYVQDRTGAVHLICTEGHPHRWENSIWYGVIRDGRLETAAGEELVADVTERDTEPADVRSLTPVFEANTRVDGELLTRAWTVDIATDAADSPVAIIQARHEDNRRDHRFLYCRFVEGDWSVEPLAPAGGYFYEHEWDYTGLAAIDPTAPNRVLVATTVDPRTETRRDAYGLFAGVSSGQGDWAWSELAVEPGVDHLRPMLTGGDEPVALWLRGNYQTYTSWHTEVKLCTAPFG